MMWLNPAVLEEISYPLEGYSASGWINGMRVLKLTCHAAEMSLVLFIQHFAVPFSLHGFGKITSWWRMNGSCLFFQNLPCFRNPQRIFIVVK